jgi:hypothetical protein
MWAHISQDEYGDANLLERMQGRGDAREKKQHHRKVL